MTDIDWTKIDSLIQENRVLTAIAEYKRQTGCGLFESKREVAAREYILENRRSGANSPEWVEVPLKDIADRPLSSLFGYELPGEEFASAIVAFRKLDNLAAIRKLDQDYVLHIGMVVGGPLRATPGWPHELMTAFCQWRNKA